ncbi:cupin domain-containing protein [Salinibacterium soli]|uniref:Cupin domain-containing protein n=1 Tax=Antiquaquibacter soli TaxID=3064523 RepID=A0ABT9BMU8_9MICO|nr:cupin domain-containing protein [Protaetiibacter sp. WY-16]MDO7882330.1 cupin domain-containing protein [Protaetiibacter sp. WY-16]
MEQHPVVRMTLADHVLASPAEIGHVEVRRITLAPGVQPGAHWHNGPVFGVIESGSVHFQVGDGPERMLGPGDTFFEPGDETIGRFDATDEGVTFLGWFPMPMGEAPDLIMGPRN